MRVISSKSKNSESFYISKGFMNDKGVNTSVIVRKLGTLKDLLVEHGPTRDDVLAWAREQARLETEKYKEQQGDQNVFESFHSTPRFCNGEPGQEQYTTIPAAIQELEASSVNMFAGERRKTAVD